MVGAPLEVRNESEVKQRQFRQLENAAQLVMSRGHMFLYCMCASGGAG